MLRDALNIVSSTETCMKTYTILLLALLVGLSACTTAQTTPPTEVAMQDDSTMSGQGMPCHMMPDGTMMGDCEGVNPADLEGMGHMMAPVTSEEQFVVEMIPHHQEAVDTSLIVEASTENEELRTLTREIIDAQEAEIAMMEEWVEQWHNGGYEPEYMNMMGDLEAVTGDERDVLYLEGMIMHHEMAVVMAEEVLALEPRAEVAEFAQAVIDVQTAEIEQMQRLLEQYQ